MCSLSGDSTECQRHFLSRTFLPGLTWAMNSWTKYILFFFPLFFFLGYIFSQRTFFPGLTRAMNKLNKVYFLFPLSFSLFSSRIFLPGDEQLNKVCLCLSVPLCLSLSLPPPPPPSPPRPAYALAVAVARARALSLALSLSRSLALSLSRARALSLFRSLALLLSRSLALSLTHARARALSLACFACCLARSLFLNSNTHTFFSWHKTTHPKTRARARSRTHARTHAGGGIATTTVCIRSTQTTERHQRSHCFHAGA